jgi:hypothetical protein
MNTSIVYSSLKYIKSNFELAVKLNLYINDQLKEIKYDKDKFIKSIYNVDIDVSKSIVKFFDGDKNFVFNGDIHSRLLFNKPITYKMLKFYIDNGFDSFNKEQIDFLEQTFSNDDVVDLLLDDNFSNKYIIIY